VRRNRITRLLQRTRKLRFLAAEQQSRSAQGMRYLLLSILLLIATLGCSGTAKRARIASDLVLEIDRNVTTLAPGGTFRLTVYLRNVGSQAIDVCLKNEHGVAVTDSRGKRWPLKLVSVVFDAECSERFRLRAGTSRPFTDELGVWPAVPDGPGVLDVWLRFSVDLGQFYWPGADQKLVATRAVSIQRAPSTSRYSASNQNRFHSRPRGGARFSVPNRCLPSVEMLLQLSAVR
jgi:hypothetical protein